MDFSPSLFEVARSSQACVTQAGVQWDECFDSTLAWPSSIKRDIA